MKCTRCGKETLGQDELCLVCAGAELRLRSRPRRTPPRAEQGYDDGSGNLNLVVGSGDQPETARLAGPGGTRRLPESNGIGRFADSNGTGRLADSDGTGRFAGPDGTERSAGPDGTAGFAASGASATERFARSSGTSASTGIGSSPGYYQGFEGSNGTGSASLNATAIGGAKPFTAPKDPIELAAFEEEKRKVIDAIKKCHLRATPTEIAAVSGLPVARSSYWLNTIASETKGILDVAKDGTIFYSFAPDFLNAYIQHGFQKAALVLGVTLFQMLYWVVRVSFGCALMLSVLFIVALFIAMIVIAIAAMFNDSGSGDFNLDLGSGGDFFDPTFFCDLFSWNYSPSSNYYPNSKPSKRRDRYGNFIEEHPKGNFFLECFSFLFGDGAPNSNLHQIRWQQIARVIKENGGVVSAEQLAPFLDGDRSDSGMILQALAQFGGEPRVTKSGYIVYVFHNFLDTNTAPGLPPMTAEPYLIEDRWQFSGFELDAMCKVLVIALLNFVGSWWLFKHIATIALLHPLGVIIDILLTYSIVFLAIPTIRFIVLQFLNARIEERNSRRLAAFQLIHKPEADVAEELEEAKSIRETEVKLLRTDRTITFSSGKDSLEQQF